MLIFPARIHCYTASQFIIYFDFFFIFYLVISCLALGTIVENAHDRLALLAVVIFTAVWLALTIVYSFFLHKVQKAFDKVRKSIWFWLAFRTLFLFLWTAYQ